MHSILPNQERARWTVIVFYLQIVLTLALSATQWWQANLIESVDLNTENAERSDLIVALVAMAYLISLIGCIIVFIMWFRRAYANLHRLEDSQSILSHSEGWAAGAWFVPFMNLVRPYSIMKEIWNETQSNIPGKIEREGLQETTIIGWWWATWIVSNVISNVTSRMGGSVEIEEIAFGLRAGAIGSALAIPAAILAIRMVQQTNVFEEELYDNQRMSDPSEHLLA